MPDWQSKFFRENWSRAFWQRHLNHLVLHFEGHRDVLLVGFDSEFSNASARNWTPWGGHFAQAHDIGYLGFSSISSDWYLDPWITEQMQALVSQGFFERFSRVVFAGHSMGGYAALQFSRMVEGSLVAAFSPQATMQADRVPFDARMPDAARQPWRGDETDVSQHRYDPARSFVFYDPHQGEDAAHARLMAQAGVQLLRSYHSGHGSFLYLNRMGIADELMQTLCFGALTPMGFYRLLRQRRTLPWFRKALEAYYTQQERPEMLARLSHAMQEIEQEFLESRHQPHAKAVL